MKKRGKIFLILFLIIVLAIALVVSLRLNYFNNIIRDSVGRYGYPAVVIFSFLADVLEQPIGPEIPSLIAVLFGLNIFYVFLFSVLGSYAGSLVSFYIGKRFLSSRIMDYCNTKKYKNYCKLFYKYGRLSILIAALTPIPFVFFCWLVGSFHMKIKDFIIYGLLPRAFRIGFILLIIGVIV